MESKQSKIPFFLVTGFLGSGKTTFVKYFLNKYSDRYRIAVIQNEFGPVNIDGRELAQSAPSIKIVELNNGSVFCVCLLPDFKSVLTDLVKSQQYDAILLEATGLADPIAITRLFRDPFLAGHMYLEHVWTIVDAVNFNRISGIKSAERQIRLADSIIINKSDQFQGDALQMSTALSTFNSLAQQISTSFCRTGLPDDLNAMDHISIQKKHLNGIPAKRPNYGTAVIQDSHPVSQPLVKRFLEQAAPVIYRLKGVIRLADGHSLAIQQVMDRIEYRQISDNQNTEFVMIGPGVNTKDVTSLWQQITHENN